MVTRFYWLLDERRRTTRMYRTSTQSCERKKGDHHLPVQKPTDRPRCRVCLGKEAVQLLQEREQYHNLVGKRAIHVPDPPTWDSRS
mmetsp:Transcript_6846/g.14062  ORF Transcript_6846/g.14062 Transcript_6846/m.14062 type:complete len:86 (-) Transcript_6846:2274-2531(-)